ncbi:hypothetical protein Tco_0991210 [Tanacetum coccineum]|uniref:Uncharacterized protein n=1 Tax=Tanacetum coccineum TaxID=301880 RepID=A0ABQ5EYL0_9ASTR
MKVADTKQLKEDELMLVKFNIENESTRILALTLGMKKLYDISSDIWSSRHQHLNKSGKRRVFMVSRKRNKVSANKGPSSSREFDSAKKVDRSFSLPNSSRHDYGNNGSAKVVHPPGSTAASSGRSSSTKHNQTSDDKTGAVTHRTLPDNHFYVAIRWNRLDGFDMASLSTPALLAEIMSGNVRETLFKKES